MIINPETGRIEGIPFLPSPHYNMRPDNCPIELLVIHNISLPPGKFDTPFIDDLFLGQLDAKAHPYFAQIASLKVSAHLLINRQGKLRQFVSLHHRAWHAGQSQWQGRDNCNDFSIGIELEGTDNIPYTEKQYQQLAVVTRLLMQYFPTLTQENIVGHCAIAPERKTDPGPSFNWTYFRTTLSR